MCRPETAGAEPCAGDVAKTSPPKRRPSGTFVAREATLRDAQALASLFRQDYVICHRGLHSGIPAGSAEISEWEAALGAVDFEEVLASPSQPSQPAQGKKKKGKQAAVAEKSIRLLKITEKQAGAAGSPVGYVLYELREKGPRTARQKYCELVNIVVQESSRGCGAGRILFDALRDDLAQTAPDHAADLRLYVAEHNLEPLNWYRRIGFQDAGWQNETIGGDMVRFIRMSLKAPAQ
eukprot:gb/GFBE01057070.1/.p1 GENE.gb/GFBE01057070.1/~~gb/GFBE01057070.1/.p1  ORF type:complete len:236 (+),score=62.03 gb/GFBE01057070.1/:1-708(+)